MKVGVRQATQAHRLALVLRQKGYDERSEMEAALDNPVVSWGWRRGEREEEERIRTEK